MYKSMLIVVGLWVIIMGIILLIMYTYTAWLMNFDGSCSTANKKLSKIRIEIGVFYV